jgi:hypothetical protein
MPEGILVTVPLPERVTVSRTSWASESPQQMATHNTIAAADRSVVERHPAKGRLARTRIIDRIALRVTVSIARMGR